MRMGLRLPRRRVEVSVDVDVAKPEARRRERTVTCPSCGSEVPVRARVCPFCGERLEREAGAVEAVLRRLREVLALRIAPPSPLVDEGSGETLASYSVGLAKVRIALLREQDGSEVTGLYMVSEPQTTSRVNLCYMLSLGTLYRSASIPPPTAIRRGRPAGLRQEEDDPLVREVGRVVERVSRQLGLSDRERLVARYYVMRDTVHFGPLTIPVQDELVEDVSCVAPGRPVQLIHRDYADLLYLRSNIVIPTDEELNDFILRLAHRSGASLSMARPYADFVLPDGSRFAGVIGSEVTAEGPAFTIRKFPELPFSLPQLVARRMLSPLMASYLWLALESRAIFGVAGPTGSGKTTLFSALLSCLNPRAKIITIEDTFEIRIPHIHWQRFTTRRPAALVSKELEISESELIDMAMRMRPNYLIVGEVRRDDSVYHLLKAAFSGHGGGFTFHAGSASEFYSRLGIMLRRSGMSETLLSYLWGCAITDHVTLPDGRAARRVIEVSEFTPDPESPTGVRIANVFRWDRFRDEFEPDDPHEAVERSAKLRAMLGEKRAVEELERRASLLVSSREMDLYEFAARVAQEVYAV